MTNVRKLRAHTKSRTGCAQCKTRKRKCDEVRPVCDRCKTAGLRCSFTDLLAELPLPASPQANKSDACCERSPKQEPDGAIDAERFTVRDMALLHHFIVSTSTTLTRDRGFQKFYQTTTVQLALSEPFLLHGILSIAALHLAQTSPKGNQENFTEAAKHHDIALTLYQLALKDLRQERYDSIFISASLLFSFIFAYVVGSPSDATFPPGDAAEFFLSFRWVRVARGIRALRKEGQQWLQSSPLWQVMGHSLRSWPMLRDPVTNINVYDLDPPCPQEKSLKLLKAIWQTDSTISPQRAEMYSEAYHGLVRAYRRAYQRNQSTQGRHNQSWNEEFIQSLGWLADLSDSFIILLEQHDPPALVLMSHYTKLLDTLSFSFWWTHRNSQICTSRIRRILPLSWHKWLE